MRPSPQPAVDGSIGRALSILTAISRHADRVSLSELARRTRVPKSTVHRILGVLESHHAVERQRGGYRLGPTCLALGNSATTSDDLLRRTLMPHLVGLFAVLGEAVSLAVLREDQVFYLETLYNASHQHLIQRTEQHAPAHATAAGKLLLAHTPSLAARYGVDVPLVGLTSNTITTFGQFAAELARIRHAGLAISREEYVSGLVGVATAVVGPGGVPIAALTVSGPRHAMDLPTVVEPLRQTAQTASISIHQLVRRPGHDNAFTREGRHG
jgi:DNA-binding IclR family transcriptional regulator